MWADGCLLLFFAIKKAALGPFFCAFLMMRVTFVEVCSFASFQGMPSRKRCSKRADVVPFASNSILFGGQGRNNDDHSLDHGYLTDLVSSPERYATALNMTVNEIKNVQKRRKESVDELQSKIARESVGRRRHRLLCQHRFEHGKHPFVCKRCWCYQPICLCREISSQNEEKGQEKKAIPCHSVVIWTHHSEWGSPSNTGSLLPLLLQDTTIQMKGLHDEELKMLLSQPDIRPLILWPDVNVHEQNTEETNVGSRKPTRLSANELLASPEGAENVVLIALEGTWRNARRMANKFPPEDFPRLVVRTHTKQDKDKESARANTNHLHESVLAPLRSGPVDSLCTAEAVVYALEELGMDRDPSLLATVARKVDQTRRYQGKVARLRNGLP